MIIKFYRYLIPIMIALLCGCQSVPTNEQIEKSSEIKAERYLEKGIASEKQGNMDIAVLYYTLANRLKKDLWQAYYRRGNIHFDRFEQEQAIDCYSQVLILQPEHHNALFNRALAYLAINQAQAARDDLLKLLQTKPEDFESELKLGIIYLDYLNQPQKARNHFERYLTLGGPNLEVREWLREIQADPSPDISHPEKREQQP